MASCSSILVMIFRIINGTHLFQAILFLNYSFDTSQNKKRHFLN